MQLVADEIVKTFSGVHALSGVTISVTKGEVVGIIGPNGSGKTTLINVISGVIEPTSGTVSVGDVHWSRRSSFQTARAGIARTFQNIRLFDEMTVLENLAVAASCSRSVHGGANARKLALEVLQLLQLVPLRDTVAGALSYGVRRRVEMARAVASLPHFVLLDEPAAGLNETESDELLSLIIGLRDHFGFGVVIIDHDLRLIMRGTRHIYVLNEGHLLAEGTPSEVRFNPKVIEAYLGSVDTPDPSEAAPLSGE